MLICHENICQAGGKCPRAAADVRVIELYNISYGRLP